MIPVSRRVHLGFFHSSLTEKKYISKSIIKKKFAAGTPFRHAQRRRGRRPSPRMGARSGAIAARGHTCRGRAAKKRGLRRRNARRAAAKRLDRASVERRYDGRI